jgi:hypothetical protein
MLVALPAVMSRYPRGAAAPDGLAPLFVLPMFRDW